jgi:cephalosporin-C deacetylase
MDAASFTHSNPYEEINDYLREYPDREPQVRATTEYFDCINLADRITCPMLVTIGLGDDVCPPETAYGLVNAMTQSEVELHAYPRCAHDAGSFWDAAKVRVFLAEHLRPAGGVK